MICIYPGCKHPTKVIATRQAGDRIVTRRRECPEQHRFTTVEAVKPARAKLLKAGKLLEARAVERCILIVQSKNKL